MLPFIGRQNELKQLNQLLKKKTASLIVVKGRRRIGKSRLIQEFGKNMKMFSFSGIPPTEQTTHRDQLTEFGWQLGKAVGQPAFQENDWNDLFLRLAHFTRQGRILIFLDEISWMGSKDPNFLGKLKNAWDLEFKNNPNLILVLCGSVSTWIDKNILSSTGFVGRISLRLSLDELPLFDCNQFWPTGGEQISPYEKLKILSVTGGVPKYLEEIKPYISAEENIRDLCFTPSGILYNEFDQIFTDIFTKRNDIYKRIILSLADGKCEFNEIYKKLEMQKSGVLSEYLDDLIKSGFIRQEHTWALKTGKSLKLRQYRICDNYTRFYLKYIFPNKEKINLRRYEQLAISKLPGWDGIMGLQFESLVLNNRQALQNLLNIPSETIIYDNPFFQHKTERQQGCQIDYMVQTQFDNLYVCEIKFSRTPIQKTIISEMREKINRIKLPRHVSCRPILIHVNGVTEEVEDSQYFAQIVDFSQFLKN